MDKKLVTAINNNGESNVYSLYKDLGEEVLLSHPLASGVLILKKKKEIDLVTATQKSPYERCLDYLKAKKHLLDYDSEAVVNSLCLYFVVHKKFTPKLKNQIARLSGIPANIEFQGNLQSAIDFVNKNKALFDDYNKRVYCNKTYRPIFEGKVLPEERRQSETVFNLTGFILAQTQTK